MTEAEKQAVTSLIKLNFHPWHTTKMRPKFINGHIVLGSFPRLHLAISGALWVVVDRGREHPRYVVATWTPFTPGEWWHGHEVETAQEACEFLQGHGVPA